MEELIQRITAATGIDDSVARQAVGLILGFLKKHAPEGAIGDLINSIPAATKRLRKRRRRRRRPDGRARRHARRSRRRRRGMMALAGQLKEKGLDMDQIKGVGQQIFEYGGEQIGPDRVREIAQGIPGLAQMMGKG
ncbi:MAG: hypothetical protein H6872_08110 [Methylobacteriaceae bacterium]|nr:hypothetical protein [Methylobacteriaceae bacterium]